LGRRKETERSPRALAGTERPRGPSAFALTTFAPLTVTPPAPTTKLTGLPCAVPVCLTSLKSSLVHLEVSTWYFSTSASFALSFASESSTSFGTFAKASSVGANTV
jgi:hypothetical protein